LRGRRKDGRKSCDEATPSIEAVRRALPKIDGLMMADASIVDGSKAVERTPTAATLTRFDDPLV
jgi:hypothetical protein